MFYPKTSFIYYIALPLPVGKEEIAEVGEMIGADISGISMQKRLDIHKTCNMLLHIMSVTARRCGPPTELNSFMGLIAIINNNILFIKYQVYIYCSL